MCRAHRGGRCGARRRRPMGYGAKTLFSRWSGDASASRTAARSPAPPRRAPHERRVRALGAALEAFRASALLVPQRPCQRPLGVAVDRHARRLLAARTREESRGVMRSTEWTHIPRSERVRKSHAAPVTRLARADEGRPRVVRAARSVNRAIRARATQAARQQAGAFWRHTALLARVPRLSPLSRGNRAA